MTARSRTEQKLARGLDQGAPPGAPGPELELERRRLQHLCEISKLLLRFRGLERTVPEVIALIARTLPIRSAVLIVETGTKRRTLVWRAPREDATRQRQLEAHAHATFAYLAQARADLDEDKAQVFELPSLAEAGPSEGSEPSRQFIILPLVVEHGAVFGALQLEGATAFDEVGLVFVNAVVNQLAIALSREAAVALHLALAETTEREQRLLAEVGAVVAASLDPGATLSAVALCAVPLFADLCIVDLVVDGGATRRLAVVFADLEKERAWADRLREFSPRPCWTTPEARVLETGMPLVLSEVDPELGGVAHDEDHARVLLAIGIRSALVVPLRAQGKAHGVLTFATAESGRQYTGRDLPLAQEIARRAAASLDSTQQYEHAQRTTRARDDLLAVVSHDLKNPLNAILLNLTMLLKAPVNGERRKAQRQLVNIKRSVERMNRLSDDLLDTTTIDGGRLSVVPSCLSVGPLVAEVIEVLAPLAAAKAVSLRTELPAELPQILGDPSRLQQVFANLLGNAIKFTPQNGAVTIRAVRSGSLLRFSVTDNGPGISEHNLPHLFDRLWKAEPGAPLGTGLGLFIVKGIIDAHGGTVWVESTVGLGSTFCFTLPVAPSGDGPR